MWGASPKGNAWEAKELRKTDLRISSFGEDEGGELYVIDHAGTVYKMTR